MNSNTYEKIISMKNRFADLDEAEQNLKNQLAQVNKQRETVLNEYIEIALTLRPTFPTPSQIEAIEKIAAIAAGDECSETFRTYDGRSISAAYENLLVNFYYNAPYHTLINFDHLWSFTDEEREAFIRTAEDHDLTVTDHWHHEGGFALRFQMDPNIEHFGKKLS